MIILRVLNLEGFSEQNILFSVVLVDKKTTQKLPPLVLIYVSEWHMNGQMDIRCNNGKNSDKAYYLLVVYEWLFSVSIA